MMKLKKKEGSLKGEADEDWEAYLNELMNKPESSTNSS